MSEKDVKQQVLEDLLMFLEDKITEKLKKPTKEEELPTEGTLIIEASPTEDCEDCEEDYEEEDEEDELDKRLKKLLSKRGE